MKIRYAILNGIGTNKTRIKAWKTDGFNCPSIFASTVWLVNSLVTSYHRIVWYIKFLCSEVFHRETPAIMVGSRICPIVNGVRVVSPAFTVAGSELFRSQDIVEQGLGGSEFKKRFSAWFGWQIRSVPVKVRSKILAIEKYASLENIYTCS